MDYEVKLEIFEGPLDLLVHLIHKNEVDIFDIPIAVIADQYLEYMDMMNALNLSVAGDFLVMASTLVHLKSKMLLPGFQDEDEEDPLIEIRQPLLEYMRLKEVAEELSGRSILDRDVFTRQSPDFLLSELKGSEPQLEVNLFQLIDAFKRIMENQIPGSKLEFKPYKWSVKEKTLFILEILKERGQVLFQELFDKDRAVPEFVVTFLALLELAHRGLIRIFQPSSDQDIHVEQCFDEENGCNTEMP